MKANQKFLNNDDEAVSPVIAVILMVAITVVLAATVYVWVSGFGSQSSQPAKTISLTSSGSLSSSNKAYTVASATSGMRWSDITATVDGTTFTFTTSVACATDLAANSVNSWRVCAGTSTEASTGTVNAGDSITVGDVSAGQTLRILDAQANSVILTLTIG